MVNRIQLYVIWFTNITPYNTSTVYQFKDASFVANNIRVRQDGRNRSPWNEPECNMLYSRAMAHWNIFDQVNKKMRGGGYRGEGGWYRDLSTDTGTDIDAGTHAHTRAQHQHHCLNSLLRPLRPLRPLRLLRPPFHATIHVDDGV